MADDTTQKSKPKAGPAGPKEAIKWPAVPTDEADKTEGHFWHSGSAVPPADEDTEALPTDSSEPATDEPGPKGVWRSGW